MWVHERHESTPIPGVSFRLYLQLTMRLRAATGSPKRCVQLVSGPDGMFSIGCVRFSHQRIGLDRDPNDPFYRHNAVARELPGWMDPGTTIPRWEP